MQKPNKLTVYVLTDSEKDFMPGDIMKSGYNFCGVHATARSAMLHMAQDIATRNDTVFRRIYQANVVNNIGNIWRFRCGYLNSANRVDIIADKLIFETTPIASVELTSDIRERENATRARIQDLLNASLRYHDKTM